MRSPVLRSVAVALAALLLLGCSDDDVDRPEDPRESPESVTEALMVLWQARDREAADRLGGDEAMDALFGVTPPDEPLVVGDCTDDPQVARARTCSARGGGQRILVTVQQQGEGWQVIAVLPIR